MKYFKSQFEEFDENELILNSQAMSNISNKAESPIRNVENARKISQKSKSSNSKFSKVFIKTAKS